MKKVFNFLFIVTLIFVLSSCGFKEEIEALEIDGDKIGKTKIETLYKEYEQYRKEINEGDRAMTTTKGWYSVSGNLTYTSNYEYDDNRKSATIKAKISGDMYDSSYVYDKMLHITIRLEIETDGNEKEDVQYIKGKYEVFAKENKTWIKGNLKYEKDDEKKDVKIYCTGYFSELMDLIPSEIKDIINFGEQDISDMQSVGYSFMAQLKNIDAQKTSVYQNDDKYTIKTITNTADDSDTTDNSMKMKSIIEVDFKEKENYIPKEYNAYCDMESIFENTNMNVSYEMSIKKKLMGIIIPPIFEGKYQSYGDSEIFPDL